MDHESEVLESFATVERDKAVALSFMKKLTKRHGCAKAITTDGLRSYKAAMKEIGIADRQEVGRWANNRAENSHQPFRRRERAMLRFRRTSTRQQFASAPPWTTPSLPFFDASSLAAGRLASQCRDVGRGAVCRSPVMKQEHEADICAC